MLPVAILAGGLATRLRPLSDQVPKSLLTVAGRPFIQHQLAMLRDQGVERVILCVGHLGEQIRQRVGDGSALGVSIAYSFDGSSLLGTGGALRQALPLLGDAFFVMNGDSYLRCSLAQIQSAFESSGRPALMTVLRNENRWDRSNVVYRDHEVIAYDKQHPNAQMAHIDFGIGVYAREVFANYAAATFIDLSTICRDLCVAGRLAAFEVGERFYEIGSPQGLRETDTFLSQRPAGE
jgi:NDP-sugar pyrophosphorylase family protein